MPVSLPGPLDRDTAGVLKLPDGNAAGEDTGMANIAVDADGGVRFAPIDGSYAGECIGVDLSRPLDAETRSAIRSAFLDYQLLAFRGQALDKPAQLRFTEYFGPLELPVNRDYLGGDYPALHVVTNLDASGNLMARKVLANPGNYFWHSDASYMQVPAMATLLYAIQVPPKGGDTLFANLYHAYEALPEATKARIDGLRAIHSWEQSRRNSGSRPATEEEKRNAPPVSHPLVRTHPETGRKALYLGNHTSHIEGMPVDEGRALLAELLAHATQERFVYRHRWRPGDLVMWDNRCLVHCASDDFDFTAHPRVLHRTVLKGTVPV
jgi:alpha-ketoglutarate-dependent taurine dioxygenase